MRRSGSVLFLLLSNFLGTQARAGNFSWDDDSLSGLWSDAANWTPAAVPGSGDNVLFGEATSGFMVDLAGDRTVESIVFNGSTSYTLNNNALTLSNSELAITAVLGATHTINSDVVIATPAPWNIGDVSGLVVNGAVSGSRDSAHGE